MSNARDIRLLVSDVDGTLVTNDKRLTDGALAAAQALRDAGVALAITSSRPPRGMEMLVRPLSLELPLGGFNGGMLINPDMTVIETRLIDPMAARATVDFLLDRGLDVWVYTEDAWLLRDPEAPYVAKERLILQFDATVVSRFTAAHLDRAVKIVGVSADFPLVADSEAAAGALLGGAASATRSNAYFLDVTNPLANKGRVVQTLAAWLDIPPAQIATIGDMQNDVLMFRQSGFSIAMGNAGDDVKAQASAVTDSNQDDGWAKAVRTLVLPRAG